MEAEVFDAELLEELEGVIDLGQRLIHGIGVLAVPRALGGAKRSQSFIFLPATTLSAS